MPDLADLFPGFALQRVDTSVGKIFARTGGSGPPLLLLHGYTQTNVMWHRVAPQLVKRCSLVIPDLPGYGWSDVPRADEKHAPYDKRSMAKVMVTCGFSNCTAATCIRSPQRISVWPLLSIR